MRSKETQGGEGRDVATQAKRMKKARKTSGQGRKMRTEEDVGEWSEMQVHGPTSDPNKHPPLRNWPALDHVPTFVPFWPSKIISYMYSRNLYSMGPIPAHCAYFAPLHRSPSSLHLVTAIFTCVIRNPERCPGSHRLPEIGKHTSCGRDRIWQVCSELSACRPFLDASSGAGLF
ncbi:hypothetical protein JAAARDRAFT_269366 [Jaapia argillacea MUCL 33604]|uniref:Uncharacterized protein n=1 Tax=Jaapia argillacea MUCL 33604 TaxID=933084 RepID=A0A067Q4S7_9AGAM|nr:hypothetical protein JAAARDRAFT_269366 [Jaapia argillacea MUCL 33604]